MLTIQQINSAIITQNWTNEQLSSMIDAIKYSRSQLTRSNIRAITLQSTVQFTNSKTGRNMVGSVKKIAQKYVTVDTGAGLWRVPANMLRVVE